ncbi:MAG: hypothetical protein SAJ37_19830 [Oscillatoria sp. PMC 1068.18]|nr:hypothetical protein [Oscillatoria sp. PMC 1076.18]MEC4990989.1 hypothetical protein [Oscillatoria sp. PMC 1068.18]
MGQLISNWIGKLTVCGWMLVIATLIFLPAYQPSNDLGTPDRTSSGGTRVVCTSRPLFTGNFS